MYHAESLTDKPSARAVLESRKRLSRSLLWKLQRNYFDRQGVQAWNQSVVPYQITSNPWIAAAYAQVIFAWLRDWRATSNGSQLDPTQPAYLIELGCGNGRFGYLFLKKLLSLLRRSELHGLPIKYVYTDFTEYNLDILRSHSYLQPLVENGLLDFARFDLEEEREIHLTESGQVLSPGTVKNPIAVLGNYVFDGVRQDVFRISGGKLEEALVSVSSSQPEADLEDPELLSRIHVTCDYQPASAADFYDDAAWNQILEGYRQRLPDTLLLFPCSALACLKNLRALAQDRLLLLSGDKGDTHEQSLQGREEFHFAVHGSISLMVNYHAIGQYVLNQGGSFLSTSHVNSTLKIAAGVFGSPGGGYRETLLAFDEFIENRGPDDFRSLKNAITDNWQAFSLQQIVNYLRLSGWDHSIFMSSIAMLLEKARKAPPTEAAELEFALQKIWETYFPLREVDDLAFHLGLLSMVILRFPAAIEFFQRSLELYGPTVETSLNMAVCHSNLGQWREALDQAKEALELDPELEAAMVLKKGIEEAIAGLPKRE